MMLASARGGYREATGIRRAPPRGSNGVPDQTSPGPGWDQSGPQVPMAPQVQL